MRRRRRVGDFFFAWTRCLVHAALVSESERLSHNAGDSESSGAHGPTVSEDCVSSVAMPGSTSGSVVCIRCARWRDRLTCSRALHAWHTCSLWHSEVRTVDWLNTSWARVLESSRVLSAWHRAAGRLGKGSDEGEGPTVTGPAGSSNQPGGDGAQRRDHVVDGAFVFEAQGDLYELVDDEPDRGNDQHVRGDDTHITGLVSSRAKPLRARGNDQHVRGDDTHVRGKDEIVRGVAADRQCTRSDAGVGETAQEGQSDWNAQVQRTVDEVRASAQLQLQQVLMHAAEKR